ncbi:plus-3-domain-containing protein [Laetiporus sulphureus 93-53]|uniref:Plus-3-domain-containing protein n=1 Tax=Laetiporus sulphureus 93-53 TaxID=1314785 RepID=A0A165F0T1_9APHY|nr:plus-3-domain-containing protein [Laetiporus sulphureus 93-53]KZT08127.1 plus-3-domain-containing protein [Laetiporus sulphureus 93-53]
MSDSEGGDLSDELLELVGATERKRRKRQAHSKSSLPKRRRPESDNSDESDANAPESEDVQDQTNPYPLEGKYIDEADKQRLMDMSEIDREDILAQRQEELQRIVDKRNLEQMLKAQSGHGEDSVAKAAKRQHAVRGATKEKSRKLDELKARRKAKDEKKRTKATSPRRDRSSSPVDMEMSDEEEEEEDGQITKYEEQEEKERKLYDKLNPEKSEEEPMTIELLESCRVTRNKLARLYNAPWFEECVKGAYVRYLIGNEHGEGVYRICEVTDVREEISPQRAVKSYQLDGRTVNKELQLAHGNALRWFPMDKVSNSPFLQKEFDRIAKTLESEKLSFPSRRQMEKKAAQITKLLNQNITESDITAMLARKQADVNKKHSAAWVAMERSRLSQARTLAARRQDWVEVAEIDTQIAELAASAPTREGSREDSREDILAKVNERNRKANLEAVRKAEMQETERKRRERKLLAAAGGTPRPSTPADPTARLKFASSRAETPTQPGTPNPQVDGAAAPIASPLPPSALSGAAQASQKDDNFKTEVLQSVDIDLGDF